MTGQQPITLAERYRRAKERRTVWESHWRECYDFALPHRETMSGFAAAGGKRTDKLFDGTAPDAVEQLAASLLGQLTPPWAKWFGLAEGPDVTEKERKQMGSHLDNATKSLQSHFDRSNFNVEMHQCYLDLVTVGTASLLFEEAPAGSISAFRFTAVPLSQVVFEESAYGELDTTYRRSELTAEQFYGKYPDATLPADITDRVLADPGYRIAVIEAVLPKDHGYQYQAVLEEAAGSETATDLLKEGFFSHSPFINFRWLKSPGEIYGRSPVMKALPDIKTANKVVELILKNASIAVTGIWQAEDDGVLNPANIKLHPGTIIPKAVGSKGLTPLESPGRFDLSQMILEDLRSKIHQALLVDKLGQPDQPRMTATEVLERSADISRLLGATYGRLQAELLTPLVTRAMTILKRRGVIADISLDGRLVDLEYKSPLARNQTQMEARGVLQWLESIQALGPAAAGIVDPVVTARWLARAYGVPADLMITSGPSGPSEDAITNGSLGPADVAGLIDTATQMAAQKGIDLSNIVTRAVTNES